MENNVIQKFRKFFSNLDSTEQGEIWDILTAIRGADANCDYTIKWMTTARIRGELLGDGFAHLPAFIATSFYVAKREGDSYTLAGLKILWKELPIHARDHIRTAINTLNRCLPKSRIRDLQKFLRF